MATEAKEFILGPPPGIEGASVMPTGRVHMFYGASGAGKSTLLFQMIQAIQEGRRFMGYATQWHPMVYIAFDRELEETHETMERVGLNPESVPQFYPAVELPDPARRMDQRLEQCVTAVRNKYPEAKVLIFDAFFILAAHGQINNYLFMAEWLQRARKLCMTLGLTIVGLVHSPKQREGERITNPRQLMQGSVAGGGFTSLGILVETIGAPEDGKRCVHVLPRNAPDEKFEMMLDERGRLVPDTKSMQDKLDFMADYFKGLPRGGTRSTADICAHVSKVKVSRPTAMRYLQLLCENGMLLKAGRGHYAPGPAFAGQMGEAAEQPAPWEERAHE